MVNVKLRYVVEDRDRHGNIRLYYRRKGQPKIRLPGPKGSPEFFKAYHAAKDGLLLSKPKRSKGESPKIDPKSIRWLCVQYFQCADFKRLDPRTQRVRRGILERFCQKDNDGEKPYVALLPRHIRIRRDDKFEKPESANGMIKALRQLFKYALEQDLVTHNPAKDVSYFSTGSQGFHSWTIDEIRQYEEQHPVGTMARLALALALYTGQRRADLVTFGPGHVQDGWLCFTQFKNRNKSPVHLEIPIVPELQRIISASRIGKNTFLVTSLRKPFTSNGFGNKMRTWCNEAGLPHCSTHGLRKAAAARLAELGRSEQEIMAFTGHKTSKEVVRYTRAASQKLRAKRALDGFAFETEKIKTVPLLTDEQIGGTNFRPKILKDKGFREFWCPEEELRCVMPLSLHPIETAVFQGFKAGVAKIFRYFLSKICPEIDESHSLLMGTVTVQIEVRTI